MGPTLGGFLTENYSWHWVFLINLPVGIVTVLGLLLFLEETKKQTHLRFDWFGFVALAVGIGALQLMLDRGEQVGWFGSTEIVVETDHLDRRLLLLLRPFAHHRRAVRALRGVQGPQFPRRLPVHGGGRRRPVRHHGAGDAVHAEPAGLSDHDRGLCARRARRRHLDRDGRGRPAADAVRGPHHGVRRTVAAGVDALRDDRLHPRTPRPTRSSSPASSRVSASAWCSCRSARSSFTTLPGASAHQRHRHSDAGPQSRLARSAFRWRSRFSPARPRRCTPGWPSTSRRSTTPCSRPARCSTPTTDQGRALLDAMLTQQATVIAYQNDFKLLDAVHAGRRCRSCC